MAWGVRRHLIRKNDYSTLKKITLAIGISCFFLTEMARSFYRPYVYAHQIDDWHVADTVRPAPPAALSLSPVLAVAPQYGGDRALTNQERELAGLANLPGFERVDGQAGSFIEAAWQQNAGVVHFAGPYV